MTKEELIELAQVGMGIHSPNQPEYIVCEALIKALAQPEQDWSMLEAMQGSLREHMARIKELEAQLAQTEQEPVAWPKTPAEISDMIGSSYVWREHKISDVEPHESDKYCVTAHDLLEAFENWNESTTPPQRKPLSENEIKNLWYEACQTNLELTSQLIVHLARNIEKAHGIKENT